jgi:hypothetical protein
MSNNSLKLFKISQSTNVDYDTYDSAIVASANVFSASLIDPSGCKDKWCGDKNEWRWVDGGIEREWSQLNDTWVTLDQVKVECVGIAGDNLSEGDVVCSSFNAG